MRQRILLPMWAFVFRDFTLTRRYITWTIVFLFYGLVGTATIALIGVAAKDFRLILNLSLGVLLWTFLASMFSQIANSISYERWEGTLEYTFMAPVSRLVHLTGISLFAVASSIVQTGLIIAGLLLFVHVSLHGANMLGLFIVLVVGSLAFMGLGLVAAVLPLMSPENGAQATNILQGVLLLISGVYYPVSVLPPWLRPISVISPATYALAAGRKLIGIADPRSTPGHLVGGSLASVTPEIITLAVMGAIFIPLGLLIFHQAESWAKRNGKLKRSG